jgi:acetylornithine/succinyldiaminopimelate/putrescine aminotransferase
MSAARIATILRDGYGDYARHVNPLVALRAQLTGEPAHVLGVDGGRLVASDGRRIECLHGTQAFGHRHPAISAAVRELLDGDAPSWLPARVNPYAGSLARRLCERANRTGTAADYGIGYFASSGTEAVEAAIKLARAVTGRPRIVGLQQAYHGCTMGAVALMAPGAYRDPFGPHLPDVSTIALGDVDALAATLAAGDVAAVIVEPIQLEGGVRPLPPAFIDALATLTARHGALLVADEIQTGLGRTGRFLASETWPRRPDVVLLGKHLGGGLMPISAMLTRVALWQRAYGGSLEASEAHNCTFSGSAAPCLAAHAALDLLDDALLERVATAGADLAAGLRAALTGLPLFDEIRGDGFAVGVALHGTDHPWLSFEHFGMAELGDHPTVGLLLCHRLYRHGFFSFVCGHDWRVLRLQPRFFIDDATLATLTAAIRAELEALCELI